MLTAELLEGELEICAATAEPVRAGTGRCCPTNRDVNATAFPERKLKPPSLNGTAVPRSSCQPGEVLLAAQAVELYLSLQ